MNCFDLHTCLTSVKPTLVLHIHTKIFCIQIYCYCVLITRDGNWILSFQNYNVGCTFIRYNMATVFKFCCSLVDFLLTCATGNLSILLVEFFAFDAALFYYTSR